MPDNKRFFVTGIGTDVGKTIVSAIMVEKLKADYWKPIQSGDLDNSDSLKVKNLLSNPRSSIFPESYKLTRPFSPHKSAVLDNIIIDQKKITAPLTGNTLIIEGAGGLMVPLNGHVLMIGLIKELNAEVILVSKNYLGSINHTLLSLYALKQYGIPLKGIIFNGVKDVYTTDYILSHTGVRILGHIPHFDTLDKQTIIDAGGFLSI